MSFRTIFVSLVLSVALCQPVLANTVAAVGSFVVADGTGSQQITDAACANPKVVIAWWARSTADATASASPGFGFGVAVDRATDQQANVTTFNADAVATTDSVRGRHTDFIRNPANGTPAYGMTAGISTFNSNGFTINKTANDGANDNIVNYLCLGGTDIEDAYLTEMELTAGTGTKTLTGVPFEGDLAMFFGWRNPTGVATGADHEFFLGVANATQQAVAAVYGDDNTGSANRQESYINNANVLAIPNGGTPGITTLGSFTGFTSDGLTVSLSANGEGVSRFPLVLIIKGTFQSHISSQARLTSTTTQDIAAGFLPKATLLAGTFATANATETTQAHLTLGAFTSAANRGLWTGDAASINTDTNQYTSASNAYSQLTNPSTVAAQAAGSMLSTGPRLTWSTADANERLFWQLSIGEPLGRQRPPVVLQ